MGRGTKRRTRSKSTSKGRTPTKIAKKSK